MRESWLVGCAILIAGCGAAPALDAGASDAGTDGARLSGDAGEPDGAASDAGPSDAGRPAIVCDAPPAGARPPAGDRALEIFRADVAADCEGNVAYAWVESRGPTEPSERDADVWLRVLPADGAAPGAAIRLTDDPGNAGNPRVAWSGSRWIVAWSDAAGDAAPVTCFATRCDFEIRFALVDPDGTIARGPEVLASGEGTHAIAAISADPGSGAALFVYIAGTDTDADGAPDHAEAFGVRMAAGGTLGEARSISRGASVQNGARAARGAGAHWITFLAGGALTTARWPDGALEPDPPSSRGITGWAAQIAAAQDGRLALWVNEGDGPTTRDQTLLVLGPDGVERSRAALTLGHGGGGPGLAWIGGRLFASDRSSTRIDLVELDPAGDGELGRSTLLESGASGLFNGLDAVAAGEAFVFEANNRFEQLLVVADVAVEP